jgi:hypothetical protein
MKVHFLDIKPISKSIKNMLKFIYIGKVFCKLTGNSDMLQISLSFP